MENCPEEEVQVRRKIIDEIMSKKVYYDILKVRHDATQSEIKEAYRMLALMLHPDKTPKSEAKRAEEAFKVVNAANAVLSDPEQRSNYDKEQELLRQERERQERDRQDRDRKERDQQKRDQQQQESGLSQTQFWLLVGAVVGAAGLWYFLTSRSEEDKRVEPANRSNKSEGPKPCRPQRSCPK